MIKASDDDFEPVLAQVRRSCETFCILEATDGGIDSCERHLRATGEPEILTELTIDGLAEFLGSELALGLIPSNHFVTVASAFALHQKRLIADEIHPNSFVFVDPIRAGGRYVGEWVGFTTDIATTSEEA